MMPVISVSELVKQFQIALPLTGSWPHKIKQYLFPRYQTITAVDGISFEVKQGERVAFIGPNGAGKSTTIKMLTGIMTPTQGNIRVLDKIPGRDRKTLAYHIAAVFGQRSQLWYHLPVRETLNLLASVYDIPKLEFEARLNTLAHQFNITQLLTKRVRELSLGERMRAEIVASLLHKPSVLFLDEPTIGLDITAKAIIRDLIREQSIEAGVTVLLTSHDTDDIEKVCDRVIIIDRGKLLLDDSLLNLKTKYIRKKVVTVATEEENVQWSSLATTILEKTPYHLKLEIDLSKQSTEKVIAELLSTLAVKDLTIEGPPLESIIQQIYKQHDAKNDASYVGE